MAIRAAGASYPALCLKSMVDKKNTGAYDVIVLEFFTRMHEFDALQTLALKIRKRYPDAILVFLRTWHTKGMIGSSFNPQASGRQNDFEAIPSQNFPLQSRHFEERFLASLQRGTQFDWNPYHAQREKEFYRIVDAVGGHTVSLPRPSRAEDFLQYKKFFASDWLHLSNEAHMNVAKQIEDLVESVGIKQNPQLGDWDETDEAVCPEFTESLAFP